MMRRGDLPQIPESRPGLARPCGLAESAQA
jgi:hypothetical protein